jgi:hypothetical protein
LVVVVCLFVCLIDCLIDCLLFSLIQVVDTGGSTGSETNALALIKACKKIKKKIGKILEMSKSKGWIQDVDSEDSFAVAASLATRCRIALSVIADVSTYDPIEVENNKNNKSRDDFDGYSCCFVCLLF